MADPDNLDPYEMYSKFSHMGKNFGNPLINSLAMMAFGHNYMPDTEESGQDMHEALIQRERSANFMNLQRSSFSNNALFQKMGISGNMATNVMAGVMSSPDSAAAKMMSGVLGGNPMAASAKIYSGLTGANVMGAFGRTGNITAEETEGVMQALSKNFYTSQNYEGPEGIKEDIKRKSQKYITDLAERKGGTGLQELKEQTGIDLTGPDGKTLASNYKEKIAKFDITEGDDARKVRDSASDKQTKTNAISNKISEATKEGDAKLKEKLEKSIEEDLKKNFKLAGEEIEKQYKKNGKLDLDKLQKDAKESFGQTSPLEGMRKENEAAKAAGSRITGFDFVKSRGFKLEDITAGFTKAAELRMLGDSRGATPAQAMDKFSKNAGGAMDAARGVFGNRSGGELMEKISQFAGSNIDLSTKGGSAEVEGLLRKTNATARVAGVSIKTMLAIIDSAKQLADNNPALQHMSNAAAVETSLQAVKGAAQMGKMMTGTEFRQAGGTQGLASKGVQESQAFAQSELGQSTFALLAASKGTDAEDFIKDMVGSGKLTAQYLNSGGIGEIAKRMGKSEQEVINISQNRLLSESGSKDDEFAKVVSQGAGKTGTESIFEFMSRYGDEFSKEKLEKKYKEEYAAKGKSVSDFKREVIMPKMGRSQQGMEMYRTYELSLTKHMLESTLTPAEKEEMDKEIKLETIKSQEVAKENAGRNAPMITQIMQGIAAGDKRFDKYDINAAMEETSKIFATGGKKRDDTTAKAMASAEDAGESLVKEISSNQRMPMQRSAELLSKVMAGKKRELESQGDTEEAAKLDTNITEQDISELRKQGAAGKYNNNNQAMSALERLEAKPDNELTQPEREEKTKLQRLRKTGILQNAEAYESLKKGDTSGAIRTVGQAAVEANQKAKAKDDLVKNQSPELQASMKEAADAGKKIIDQTTKKGGIRNFEEENTAEDINKITEANKKSLIEAGRGEEANSLGNVSNKELEALTARGKDVLGGMTIKNAEDELINLEKDEKEGKLKKGSKEKEKLDLLRAASKIGGLTSQKAFEGVTSGKREQVAMATLEVSKATQNKVAFDTQKKGIDEQLSKDLDKYEKSKGSLSAEQKAAIGEARQAYTKDGKVDFDQMRKDQSSGEGIFKGNQKKFEALGGLLQGSSKQIEEAKAQTIAKNEQTGSDPMKQGLDALKDLIGLIKSGGGIGKALEDLAKAISHI
jgi:hypothetical protein